MKFPRFIYTILTIGTFAALISSAHGQEKRLETIVVIGKQQNPIFTDLAGSVDVLSQDELAYEHVDDTLELFNKAPGVYLSRYNQGIINTDIAIRGFAGDGVTPHAKLLIDGIPANLHNGYNELDQLLPLNIASIAVFKGTSDPRYGLYNIAGNYNVATRQDEALEIETTIGSFNTREVQSYAGFSNDSFTHNYSAGYRISEGYRDHTDLDKYALAGSWQWQFSDTTTFRVIARYAGYEGDSPGYLTKAQASANPEQSTDFANQDGGDKETRHLSTHWSQMISDDLQWQFKAYAQTFERERWVRFSEAGSLQDRFDDQTQWGLISTLSWTLSDRWELDWGLDYESQDNLEQRFGTVGQTRVRDTSNVIRNFEYDFITYGSYLNLSHELSDTLRWNVALRVDQLDGDFTNRAASDDRDIFDFGTIVQPKFNIVYAHSDTVNLFANAGRSFQHPFGSSAYTAGDKNARDVSINDGWEAGAQWSPSAALTLRLSYWQQKASDEFVVVDGTPQNVGETKRSGFDVASNGTLSDAWSYWGSFTVIDSKIVKASDTETAFEGNQLRSIPDYTGSFGLNYQVTPKLITRVHIDTQGEYYVNEANLGGKFGDYTILSATADYDTGWGNIKLQLNNLTDQSYEYVYDFSADGTSTIHSPGDGMNGSASVSWKL